MKERKKDSLQLWCFTTSAVILAKLIWVDLTALLWGASCFLSLPQSLPLSLPVCLSVCDRLYGSVSACCCSDAALPSALSGRRTARLRPITLPALSLFNARFPLLSFSLSRVCDNPSWHLPFFSVSLPPSLFSCVAVGVYHAFSSGLEGFYHNIYIVYSAALSFMEEKHSKHKPLVSLLHARRYQL